MGPADARDATRNAESGRRSRRTAQRIQAEAKGGRRKKKALVPRNYAAALAAFGGASQGLPGGQAPNGAAAPNAPPQVNGPAAAGRNGGGGRQTTGGLVRVP